MCDGGFGNTVWCLYLICILKFSMQKHFPKEFPLENVCTMHLVQSLCILVRMCISQMEKWIRKSDKNSLWVFSFNSIHLCAEFFVFDSYFFSCTERQKRNRKKNQHDLNLVIDKRMKQNCFESHWCRERKGKIEKERKRWEREEERGRDGKKRKREWRTKIRREK